MNIEVDFNPLISVITPTYNRANYIAETIESVLNQTYKNIEYIIVDDGSSDNTKKIIQPYLSDSRIKYVFHENMGEAKTTNRGYSLASGELSIVLNSDDPLWDKNYFEIAVNEFRKHSDILAIYPNWANIDENSELIGEVKTCEYELLDMLLSNNLSLGPGMIIKTDILRSFGFRNEKIKYTGDLTISLKLAQLGKIMHLDLLGASHRNHKSNISNTANIKEIALEVLDLYLRIFNYPIKEISKDIIKNKKRILRNALEVYKCYTGKPLPFYYLSKYKGLFKNCFEKLGYYVKLKKRGLVDYGRNV